MAKIVQLVAIGNVQNALDDSGRMWFWDGYEWCENRQYPPGCDPNKNEEAERLLEDTPPGSVL